MAVVVAMIAAMVCGCETTGDRTPAEEVVKTSGPTPVEQVTGALAAYHAAIKAQDVENIMAAISDDFRSSTSDKDGLRAFFEGAVAQGVFLGMRIGAERCKVVVTGNTATATPVTYGGSGSSSSYKYSMRKEADGMWRIVSSEQIY